MATVQFSMDAGLFSAEVIARTAHGCTSHFFVEIVCGDNARTIVLTPKHEGIDLANIEGRFRNDALDERLRERIRTETAELQMTLVQAVFRQAPYAGLDREIRAPINLRVETGYRPLPMRFRRPPWGESRVLVTSIPGHWQLMPHVNFECVTEGTLRNVALPSTAFS